MANAAICSCFDGVQKKEIAICHDYVDPCYDDWICYDFCFHSQKICIFVSWPRLRSCCDCDFCCCLGFWSVQQSLVECIS